MHSHHSRAGKDKVTHIATHRQVEAYTFSSEQIDTDPTTFLSLPGEARDSPDFHCPSARELPTTTSPPGDLPAWRLLVFSGTDLEAQALPAAHPKHLSPTSQRDGRRGLGPADPAGPPGTPGPLRERRPRGTSVSPGRISPSENTPKR